MTRIYLWLAMVPVVFSSGLTPAAERFERGNLVFDNIPQAKGEFAATLDRYLAARQATPLGWGPAGQMLIATRFGAAEQLHLLERPSGMRRQLTFMREPITEAAFSADPLHPAFLFLKDTGGDENAQLYYQRLGEPTAKLLTDGKSLNSAALWSTSGRAIAFASTARDGVTTDIDIVEPGAGTLPHLALSGDGAAWYPLDWSPDDRKLLVLKYVSVGEGYLYVVDIESGQKHAVDAAPFKVGIAGAKFSRDGQGVYYLSDRDADVKKLRYANLFTAEKTVLSTPIPWDIDELAIARDGHYLAYVSNEGGASRLNLLDLKTHQDLTPPRLPAPGVIDHLLFDADGKRLAFAYAAAAQPRDAYVLELASGHLEPWTHSEAGAVDAAKFVTPRVTEFPTFDRSDGRVRQEPVYVYEPASPGVHPVLIVLHDGPESQFRPSFDPWIQYVVGELGFAVVAPNVRGSSGYGKAYRALDDGMLRDDAVKDLGALIVWVGAQTGFDPKHVVVAGGCYGGFLALSALTNYGDRLAGAVEVAGMADVVSFVGNAGPWQLSQRRAEFGDERDPDMRAYLRRISPLTNVDRIAKPLLVVHGKNDLWVPVSESDQMVARLRGRGGDVWYLQAKDEGHEFRRPDNRAAYYASFAQFIAALR